MSIFVQVPLEADGSLHFFWIDAYEDNNKPGRIYLFGKVRSEEAKGKPAFVSCCLQVSLKGPRLVPCKNPPDFYELIRATAGRRCRTACVHPSERENPRF